MCLSETPTMNLRSLGYRTDLFFVRFDGEVLDRGDYVVVRSPLNPTHYWGNFLLFDRYPEPGELARWRELFAAEVGTPPRTEHVSLVIDVPNEEPEDLTALLEPGFELLRSLVLTSRRPCPPAAQDLSVEVRILTTDAEWEQARENQVACRDPVHELEMLPDLQSLATFLMRCDVITCDSQSTILRSVK